MNEQTHIFIKINLSHFILERVAKGLMLVMCERWAGDGNRLQHIVLLKVLLATIAALLPHLGWAAQPWVAEGPNPLSGADSHSAGNLSPTATGTELELTDWLKLSVAPGYIIVWHPPVSCGRTHLHRIQPRPQVKVIFRYRRPDAPVSLIYTCASLDWRLGRGSICYSWIYW